MYPVTQSVTLTVLLLLCALPILKTEDQFEKLRKKELNPQHENSLMNENGETGRYKRAADKYREKAKPETCEALKKLQSEHCSVAGAPEETEIEGVVYKTRRKRFWGSIGDALKKAANWVKKKAEKAFKGVKNIWEKITDPTAWGNAWRQVKIKLQNKLKGIFPNMPDFVKPHEPYYLGMTLEKSAVTCNGLENLGKTLCP